MIVNHRRVALLAIISAIVPALAIGAPRKKTKKPPPPATDASGSNSGSGSDSGSASTAPATTPAATDATPTTAPSMPATPANGTAGAGSGSATDSTGATGSGSGSAAAPAEPDVDSLRQEYLSLRDELFKSRARASTVASQLYSTRVTIKLTYTTARFYGVSKSSIRLDGANIYDNAAGSIATDDGVRFDGYIAPGRHLITFHVEATGKDDDAFTSSTEAQIVVEAVAGKDLLVAARAKDSGDIAYEWKKHEHGSYGLGIDVAVKTVPREGADKGKAK